MAFKKMVERLTKPVDELDRQELSEYCDARHFEAMDHLAPRQSVQVGGEVRAVRIVPRAGSARPRGHRERRPRSGGGGVPRPAQDRRPVAGSRVAVKGVVASDGNRSLVFNPIYEILS